MSKLSQKFRKNIFDKIVEITNTRFCEPDLSPNLYKNFTSWTLLKIIMNQPPGPENGPDQTGKWSGPGFLHSNFVTFSKSGPGTHTKTWSGPGSKVKNVVRTMVKNIKISYFEIFPGFSRAI